MFHLQYRDTDIILYFIYLIVLYLGCRISSYKVKQFLVSKDFEIYSNNVFLILNYYKRRRNTERGTPKECWCGAPSDIFTSGSETNPGRLYYYCAKGNHKVSSGSYFPCSET